MNEQLVGHDLHLAGGQVGVFGAFRTQGHLARDVDHRLGLQVLQLLSQIRIIMRLQLDLRDAFAVTQIDKDDPALVADCIHPAGQRRRGADVSLGDLGTVMGALHSKDKGEDLSPAPRWGATL